MFREVVVGEADDDEQHGQDDEAHELDRFAADGVNCGHGHPVARNGSGADNDQVAYCGVAEDAIHIGSLGVANCLKDDGVVEAKTVESDIEEEP